MHLDIRVESGTWPCLYPQWSPQVFLILYFPWSQVKVFLLLVRKVYHNKNHLRFYFWLSYHQFVFSCCNIIEINIMISRHFMVSLFRVFAFPLLVEKKAPQGHLDPFFLCMRSLGMSLDQPCISHTCTAQPSWSFYLDSVFVHHTLYTNLVQLVLVWLLHCGSFQPLGMFSLHHWILKMCRS